MTAPNRSGNPPPPPRPDLGNEPDWRTPAERSDYRTTPDYAETLAYLARLAGEHPGKLRIESFGRTGEGRDLKVAILSKDGLFDPTEIRRRGCVVLLVQNSIHAGETDGKDACLALIRDLLRDPRDPAIPERVVLLIVPVYNVDGHERRSAYHRINQNGPELMGWRANATNLNLNRDYMKAEAPETRAFLRMFSRWRPDFFVDNHVTDGADFQYEVTFGLDATPDVFPATAAWIRESVTPELERRLNTAGHLTFPGLVNLVDESDPSQGLAFTDNSPRFSTGYMILENRPGLLVEMHMRKDYRTRVSADRALLCALLKVLDREAGALIALNREADRSAAELGAQGADGAELPLRLEWNGETSTVAFRGRRFVRVTSPISGSTTVRYESGPWEATLSVRSGVKVSLAVRPPAGYIVPPAWTRVIEVLEVHGLSLRRTTAAWTGPVERYRCSGMRWPTKPFEGRFPILAAGNVEREMGRFGTCVRTTETLTFLATSVVVPLDQRLSKFAVHWLEPAAPDSALRWGFFDPIFEQKETGEAYVVEALAERELAQDKALAAEFARRLEDPEFASSPAARLEFFYARSPWGRANRVGEYPVGRLASLEGLPLD